jgi:hypothetical protein
MCSTATMQRISVTAVAPANNVGTSCGCKHNPWSFSTALIEHAQHQVAHVEIDRNMTRRSGVFKQAS